MATQPLRISIDPAAEAHNLADIFYSFSEAVNDYRLGTPGIGPTEQARLKKAAEDLDDRAHKFTAEAIGATITAIQADLGAIKAATSEAKGQFARLNSVAKAISMAEAVLALGAAVSTGNAAGIMDGVNGLTQAMG